MIGWRRGWRGERSVLRPLEEVKVCDPPSNTAKSDAADEAVFKVLDVASAELRAGAGRGSDSRS